MFFEGLVYTSGYLFLVFIAICLACGLYFLAELAEEYPSFTGSIIKYSIWMVLAVHPCLWMFESFPILPVATGMLAHGLYYKLLETFPFTEMASPVFLSSIVVLCLSHYFWITYFSETWWSLGYIMGFFFTCVWLVPFTFFISLSINENVLPCEFPSYQQEQAQGQNQNQNQKNQKKGFLLTVFDFLRRKKDDVIVDHAPPSWHMGGKDF